jgi:CHASE2 domain-containing sensor protein
VKLAQLKSPAVTIGISGVVVIVVALMRQTTAFQDLNLWTYDFLVNHVGANAPSSHVVIVDFDDATFERIQRFPIPRNQVAEVIERVGAAKPSIIGLDFLLSEPRTPAEDQAMQAALTNAGNVIVVSQWGAGGLPSVLPMPQFCQPETGSGASGFCTEGTPGAMGFAFINLPVDSDGFIRRMMLFSADAHPAASFPLSIAQQYSGEAIRPAGPDGAQFAGHFLPYAERQLKTVLIGGWSANPAPSLSASELLDGKIPNSVFAKKIVLIGQSSDAARDREFTPVFRRQTRSGIRLRLSGTQIHATAIETLLSGNAIRPTSTKALFIIGFLLACLATWILLQFAPRYSLLTICLLLIGCYVVAQTLFQFQHRWLQFLTMQACVTLAVPFTLTYQFVRERFLRSAALQEREQVMGLFSRYVAPEVANEIWKRRNEVVLAGEERVATVLFSDIRSFTAVTAGKPSKTVLAWLNQYLTAMDQVITEEGGFLNKFIGDGLMVLFGVPLSHGTEEDAARALRTAIRMNWKVQELNHLQAHDPDYLPLKIGVGIHTGPLTCGNVGSQNRLEYSVIGETVNLASRLESLTKDFRTEIVISEATYQHVAGHFPGLRDLGPAHVRGFEEKIRLYAIDLNAVTNRLHASVKGAER